MLYNPQINGFVVTLNDTEKMILAYTNLPDFGLADFVFKDRVEKEGKNAPALLEQDRTLIDAVEAMRHRETEGLSKLVQALNDSLSNLPRFKVEGQTVKRIDRGTLALQLALVIDQIDWKLLKRCRECKKFFYGGGKKKVYCKRTCERKSNARYNPERDRIRIALYQFNKRLKRDGYKPVSKERFINTHYKPRGKEKMTQEG